MYWRKIILFTFAVLLPAVIVGIRLASFAARLAANRNRNATTAKPGHKPGFLF
jgi:hypothetical protein